MSLKFELLLEGSESKRLLFRRLREDDFDTWMEFVRHPESDRYWQEPSAEPEVKCWKWFDRTFDRYAKGEGGMNVLIEKATG